MGLASSELSAADVAAVMGNNGGNGGWNEGGSFWIVILFLFALMGGYGNGGWGNNGGGFMPWMMGNSDVQRGFDQSAIMNGITGLTSAVSNGFANAEISRCNGMTNVLQAMNTNQTLTTQGMNTLAMSLQNSAFQNSQAIERLGNVVTQEACADRAAINDALRDVLVANNASTQRILDQMCQDKIDAKNEQIQSLQNQLYMANLAASQNAQTAAIIANNEAQTAALESYLMPPVRPAYIVPNPNCCQQQWNGCGCGM